MTLIELIPPPRPLMSQNRYYCGDVIKHCACTPG